MERFFLNGTIKRTNLMNDVEKEKTVASPRSQVAKDAAILTTSKLVTACLSFAVTMLLSRYRTLEEYGTYSSMVLVINLASSILMLGLPNCISYFLARSGDAVSKRKFLSVYYTLNTVLSLSIGLLLTALLIPIQLYFHNDAIGSYWFFLLFFPWATITNSTLENVLVVYDKTKYLLFFKLLESLLVLLTVGIAILLNSSFVVYLAAYTIVEVVFGLGVYVLVHIFCGKLAIAFDKTIIKEIFVFSIPLGLATALGTLDVEIDKFMIGKLMSTEDLAVYTNAARELPVSILSSALTTALLPKMVVLLQNKKNDEATRLWGSSIVVSFGIICVISFGCIVYAPEVMSILYSDKYSSGVEIFRVYCLVLLFRCTYWGIVLNSLGKTKFILFSSLISLVLNVGLNFAFYYLFGMIGCAVATVVSIALVTLLQLIYTSRVLSVKFSRLLPWGKMLLILLLNGAFGVLFYFFKSWIPLENVMSENLESVILGVFWLLLYLPCLFFVIRKDIYSQPLFTKKVRINSTKVSGESDVRPLTDGTEKEAGEKKENQSK